MYLRVPLRTALVLLSLVYANAIRSQEPTPSPPGNQPKPDERVIISVDEEKITAADIQRFIEALPPQFRAYYGGPGRQQLPRYIVQMKILAAEAKKEKLEDRPEVQKAIAIARESILADAARKTMGEKVPVSDQEVQGLYEKRKSEFDEVRIRHLLIRADTSPARPTAAPTSPPLPEADARKKIEDLRSQLQAGGDFAELAQANSEDLGTAGAGGDMGYINRQKVFPPIANAAYELAVGTVSDIIQTPYGFEIIKVEDRRVKPLAEVRPELEGQLRQRKVEEVLQKLQAQYKVVVDAAYFAPPKKTARPHPPSPSTHP